MVKRTATLFGILAVVLGSTALAGDQVSDVAPVATRAAAIVVDGVDPEAVLEQQAELHRWLVTQEPANVGADVVGVELTDRDRQDLAVPFIPGSMTPMRVGVVKAVSEQVGLVGGRVIGEGQKRDGNGLAPAPDGGLVWATTITSPGAVAMRIHFEDFSLPPNAEVYLFSAEGDARGPYVANGPDGTGEFWSHSINSSTGTILLRVYGAKDQKQLRGLSVRISEIAHIAKDFPGRAVGNGGIASSCSYNASCIENNECGGTSNPTGNGAEGAVAKMRWIGGAFVNICSGGLLADTAGSQTPYFLTANHCINKGKDSKNLETFFQYTAPCGTTNCPAEFGQPFPPTTMGSSIRATGSDGDFTLLELDQTPSLSGTVFLGWNNTPVAFNSGAALHRVSHPSGAPQSYSNNFVDTGVGTCFQTARGSWIYSDSGNTGGTEGGSSGSPAYNAAGEVVGQLTGCCPAGAGANCNDVCNPANSTIDGALAHYWSSVAEFLDPQGGEDPFCGDGNCDPGEDETNCPEDCSGGCSLGGKGDPCSSGANCCSGTCKRNGTCR